MSFRDGVQLGGVAGSGVGRADMSIEGRMSRIFILERILVWGELVGFGDSRVKEGVEM
jgi:hypothetical protein